MSEIKGTSVGRKAGLLTVEFAAPRPKPFWRFRRWRGRRGETRRPDAGHRASGRPASLGVDGPVAGADAPAHPPHGRPRRPRTVHFNTVAAAQRYRIEISRDSGVTWQSAGETATSPFVLRGLPNGRKVHVRVIALNDDQQSRPAAEYPLYVTDRSPPPPDGLKLTLMPAKVYLNWGEVLGITEYRLYRRMKGQTAFHEVFRGRANEFVDQAEGTVPRWPFPVCGPTC